MKNQPLAFGAVLFAMVMAAAPLYAQQAIPLVGAGVAFGSGDLSNDTNTGWFAFGGVDISVPAVAPNFAVGATVSYAQIPYAGGFSEKTQLTTIAAELSYLFGTTAVKPYVRAGAGLQVNRYDPGTLNTFSTTDVGPAFTAGAGVSLKTNAVNFLVGGRFDAGRGGGYFGLNAGLSFPLKLSK